MPLFTISVKYWTTNYRSPLLQPPDKLQTCLCMTTHVLTFINVYVSHYTMS